MLIQRAWRTRVVRYQNLIGIHQSQSVMDWHDIDGWFTDADAKAYERIVSELPQNGGHVVEVGTWLGRSCACLIELCNATGKTPRITVVDTFTGSPNDPNQPRIVKENGGSVHHLFYKNMEQYRYPALGVWIGRSITAALDIANGLDAVFIDGNHDYDFVSADIKAWLPKIKSGGIIAGHDICGMGHEGVIRAVNELIGEHEVIGRCWLAHV